MDRRRLARVFVAVFIVFVLLATIAPIALAHEGDSPTPTEETSSSTDVNPPSSFPPIVPGVSEGNRVYVRSSAVNPTEYLILRQSIVDAGFPDVLEVAPGSLIVDVGSMSLEEATAALMKLDKVSTVAPAPAYASSSSKEPVSFPAWWWYLPVALAAVLLTSRRRSLTAPHSPVSSSDSPSNPA